MIPESQSSRKAPKINSSEVSYHDSITQEAVERVHVRAEVEDAGTISEDPPVEESTGTRRN